MKKEEIKLPNRSTDETAYRRARARLNRVKQGDRKVKPLASYDAMPQGRRAYVVPAAE